MRRGYFTARDLRPRAQRIFKHGIPLLIAASAWVASASLPAAALEKPKPEPATKFLGQAVTGSNYKVNPTVRSDGVMRLFDVETSFGQYQFDGVEFTKLRLHELDAVAALDKMSQSERIAGAFGRAALGPVKFGADLITNPAGTVERSVNGITNMFDRVGAGLANSSSDRDNMVESLLGVSDTQRELAVELDVDPYTDFPPLAQRLKQMATAMAGGGLPVRAGLAVVPGGVGIAVSSVATVSSAKDMLRDKSAAQVITEVRSILMKLDVPDADITRLINNRNYTPADLLIMALALKKLNAQNSDIFVEKAATANTRNVAFYQRRRAQILAARSNELGGIVAFISAGGQPVNVTRNGNVVAAFTVDDIAWTDIQQRTFVAANAEIRRVKPGTTPVLATTGIVSPMAASEIGKLGWKIVQLKP